MKTSKIFIIVLLALLISTGAVLLQKNTKDKSNFPVIKGPYLGQKPPGMTPKTFAPNIISTNEYHESCSGFMKKGTLFIFSPVIPGSDWKYKPTYFMQLQDAKWTNPISLGNHIKQDFFCAWITFDGKYIFFHSQDNSKGNIYWVSAEIVKKLRPDKF